MTLNNKVLLIEDDKIDQIAFKRLMNCEGINYELTIADSVTSAKSNLKKNEYDIVILDYSLGDGTAFDLIDLINDIPIIFTTGVGDEETAVTAMKAGVYDYIIKDIDRNYIKLLPIAIESAIKAKKDKEQLKMISQAIMNVNDIVYITDMEYNFKFVNCSFVKNYGYVEKEVIGKSCSLLWNDTDTFENSKNFFNNSNIGEFIHRKRDGQLFPILISRSIIKDNLGNNNGIINIVRDISERIAAQEKLLVEKERAQSYLDIAGVIIIMIDRHQNVRLINKKGCEVLGCEKCDILDKNWFNNFVPISERLDLKGKFNKWITDDEESLNYIEYPVITRCQGEKIISWHNILLKDKNGESTGVLCSGEDITMRMEIDRLKSEFINTLSHEIRTPLTIILGICQLLLSKEELDSLKINNYLNIMYSESKMLTELVNDYLDIQRMETGRQVFEKEKMCIEDVLDETIELHVTDNTHKIILDMDKICYSPIFGDYSKIKQLITNLLSNAIKYSPDSEEVIIKIRESYDSIIVSVIDHGLGIPEEFIPDLFNKFYRINLSEYRNIPGTGLGLAICKEIVEAHDGEIGVISEVGTGSEFYFKIPKIDENLMYN